jgi:outer membrane receptor protein involved in Fe transport
VQDAAHPYSIALYAQNKMEYEGLVLRYGARWDAFNSGTKRLVDIHDPTGQTRPGDGSGTLGSEDYESSKNDYKISPRLSVSFPVSEKSQFRLSYGKFFQQPRLQDLYIGPVFLRQMSLLGGINAAAANPNLEAEESTQYEVGLRRALTEHAVIDISAYYKDIENLVNVQSIVSNPQSLSIATNLDEAVVQGMTLALELRRLGNVSSRLSYTLSSARGTGSAEASNLNNAWANLNDTKITAPLAFDQRHTFNASLDVRTGKGEGPTVGGIKPLENSGVNFLANAGSGFPYTPLSPTIIAVTGATSGRAVGRRNSENLPWTFRVDMKADKTFYINAQMNVNVYVQVLNLFNRKNIQNVYGSTGQPDDDGYLETLDGRSKSDYYRQQYSVYYKDGFNWDTPRQARLGVLFNF